MKYVTCQIMLTENPATGHEDPVKAMIRYQDINRDRNFREKIQKMFSALRTKALLG